MLTRRAACVTAGLGVLASGTRAIGSAPLPCDHLSKRALLRKPVTDIYSLEQERQRYVFTHMTEVYRHSRVKASNTSRQFGPSPPEAVRAFEKLKFQTPVGVLDFRDASRHVAGCDGVIVLHGGKILFEDYPAMNNDDCHLLMSSTKALVGTAIARYVDRGLIDIRKTPADYIQCLRSSGWARTPILDILNMTSGIEAVEHSEGATTNPSNPYYNFEGSLGYIPRRSAQDTYEVVADYRLARPPGQLYEYSSVNTFVLGWILEAVSSKPLNDILSAELWMPAGCETDAYLLVSEGGAAGADGGLSATLRDVGRVGQLLLDSALGRSSYLSTEHFSRIVRLANRDAYIKARGAMEKGDDEPFANAWQWDAVWNDGDLAKSGWGGQLLYVSPRAKTVMVYFSTVKSRDEKLFLPDWCRQVSQAVIRANMF